MKRNRKFSLERLEDRQLMAGDLAANALGNLDASIRDRAIPAAVAPAVPAYSSNPGAAATLYLDFDGHFEAQWGIRSNVTTPVYSSDSDTTSFASYELAAIKEVWQRVAEDFAPFNINVTTVDPGDFSNGKALRVAIGGSWQDWLHEPAGGVANRDSFTNAIPNTAYVFSNNVIFPRLIADAVSQEAGHSFGLAHQSVVNANGVLVEEYAPGTTAKAPLMGGTEYTSERTTWFYGTSSDHDGTKFVMQDDMAKIAASKNGFGYRPDDFGSTTQDAYRMGNLSSYGPISNISGFIGKTSDADWFQFNVTTTGRLSLQANVATVGANLDARLSLFRLEHQLVNGHNVYTPIPVATSDPSTSLNASLAANLTPGNYIAVVSSHGEYGDVGYYMLNGTFSQPLVVSRGLVVAPTLTVMPSIAPTTPTAIAQTTLVTSSSITSNAQLLAAPTSGRNTSPALQSTSNLTATSASLRALAVDEALATRVRVKTHKLPDELFDLLAAS